MVLVTSFDFYEPNYIYILYGTVQIIRAKYLFKISFLLNIDIIILFESSHLATEESQIYFQLLF